MDTIERTQAQSVQSEETISLIDVLRVLVERRRFIVASTLLGALFIVIFALYTSRLPNTSRWNVMPNTYTATAEVRLLENPSSSLSAGGQGGATSSLAGLLSGATTPGATNAELALALLKGDTLADDVAREMGFVQRYHLTDHPLVSARNMFRHNLKVNYTVTNGIISIGYSDLHSQFAANVVNKTIDVLQQRFNQLNLQQVSANANYLEGRMASAKKDLEAAQNRLIAFMDKHGIVDLQAQSQAQTSQIASLDQQIQAKEIQLATLRHYGRTQNDPSVKQITTDVEILRNLVKQLRSGTASYGTTGGIPVDQLPRVSAQYVGLRNDVATQESVLALVQSQYLTSKLQMNAAMKTLQVVERARPPESASKPNRKILAMVFTVLVFLFAVLIAFIREYFDKARQDPLQAAKLTRISESLGRNHAR